MEFIPGRSIAPLDDTKLRQLYESAVEENVREVLAKQSAHEQIMGRLGIRKDREFRLDDGIRAIRTINNLRRKLSASQAALGAVSSDSLYAQFIINGIREVELEIAYWKEVQKRVTEIFQR